MLTSSEAMLSAGCGVAMGAWRYPCAIRHGRNPVYLPGEAFTGR
ncbi:hypothetical protein [Prescottella subtropica]|nr:hypothetical protein [Prescottella subtropica]